MQVEFEIEDDELATIVVNSKVFNDSISNVVSENIDYKEVAENALDEIKDDLTESIIGTLLDSDDAVNCIADKMVKHNLVVEILESINKLDTKYSQLLDKITNLEAQNNKKSWWQRFYDWLIS